MAADWQIIESGSLSPDVIMAKDFDLLEKMQTTDCPILHLYEWETPCLTYGYFTDPAKYLHLSALESEHIQMARRPTGGGIIFHLTDFAFSAFLPANHSNFSLNTLENYAFINTCVAEVIAHFHQQVYPQLLVEIPACSKETCVGFCMAKPTQYDLVLDGKKVGGAAQRRTKRGFLHQGSISLILPQVEMLQKVLKNASSIISAMQENTYCLLPQHASVLELNEARQLLKLELIKKISLL